MEMGKYNREMKTFEGIGCITDRPGYKVCGNQFELYAASIA